MGKFINEYTVGDEKFSVEIKSSVLLGRVTVTINGESLVMKSAPFCIKKSEPFKIGDKLFMLKVSPLGKISVE